MREEPDRQERFAKLRHEFNGQIFSHVHRSRTGRMIDEEPGRILLQLRLIFFHRFALLGMGRVRAEAHRRINIKSGLVLHSALHLAEKRLVIHRVLDAGFAEWQRHVGNGNPGKHRNGAKDAGENNFCCGHMWLLEAASMNGTGRARQVRNWTDRRSPVADEFPGRHHGRPSRIIARFGWN